MTASRADSRLFEHTDVKPRTNILVLGLGGAGSNCVSNIEAMFDEGPRVIAADTDAQSLAGCGASRVMQIGEESNCGLSANGDPNVGRLAMEESLEKFRELLQGVDILFLAVGLGGGTGSGGAPLLLQTAHNLGVMTLCFVTLPFPYESDSRKLQAEESLRTMQRISDAVVVLPNEKLIELVDPSCGLQEAFRKADEQVGATIFALWHLLSFRGVLNLDFADLRHLVERSGGICQFGYGEGQGASRTATAVRSLMDSPYLNKGRSLSEAGALLVNITGGPDLTLADVQGIMSQISTIARPGASTCFGAMIVPSMKDRIALTAITTEAGELRSPVPNAHDTIDDISEIVEARVPAKSAPAPLHGVKQSELEFGSNDKGRFENMTATTFNGEDIDIPTYIRRNVKLSFER